jgi:hypothetical protein
MGKLLATEDGHPGDQHIACPWEREAALDEELAAIRGNDLSRPAPQLESLHREARPFLCSGLHGLVEGID